MTIRDMIEAAEGLPYDTEILFQVSPDGNVLHGVDADRAWIAWTKGAIHIMVVPKAEEDDDADCVRAEDIRGRRRGRPFRFRRDAS